MHQKLKRHPDSRCAAATQIEVEVRRPRPGHLTLRYALTGRMRDMRLPPAGQPKRGDELWRHSCFEAFVCGRAGGAYYEFNFAPSLQWAAYGFSAYRRDMRIAQEIAPPHLAVQAGADGLTLDAALTLNGAASLPGDATWRVALSAVIEETNGNTSYWALAHQPGKPDFHHSDCFVLTLPGA